MTPSFHAAVEQHYKTNMAANDPTVALHYENVPVPEDVSKTFSEIFVIAGDTFQNCIDQNSKSRNVGIVHINVFTPKDQGAGEGRNIAHRIGKSFRRLNLVVGVEGVAVFREPTVKTRGEVRGMHKEVVTIPYHYDFTPT